MCYGGINGLCRQKGTRRSRNILAELNHRFRGHVCSLWEILVCDDCLAMQFDTSGSSSFAYRLYVQHVT